MKVLIAGNPLLKNDSLPLRILPQLKNAFPGIEFKEIDPWEDLHEEGRELLIIDSAKGIKKTILIEDLSLITEEKVFSLHDFDLGATLKLLKKSRLIDSAKIICVPQNSTEKKAFSEVFQLLKKIANEKPD